MIKRLAKHGALRAKVQRPDYRAPIYKGGYITVSASANGYTLHYESSEVPRWMVKAWPLRQQDEMITYLLTLANDGCRKPVLT